jgi:hypothetical protein
MGVGHKSGCKYIYTHKVNNSYKQKTGSDQEEAKQALMQIIKILQQMVSQGATDEQIEAFLQEVGITMEELQQAREMFGI